MSVTPKTFVYKTAAGCAIKADVYRAAGAAASARAPVLVFIHGGCLMYGSRRDIHPRQLDLYLAAGCAVVAIDYRLAPESKLPAIAEDLADAFAWIRRDGPALFGADPDRIAVVGHSAGGYLTLLAGCRVRPRPRALVAFYGYGDIVAEWYTKPDPFYCREGRVSEEESGRAVKGPVISEPYEGRGKDKLYLFCRQNGLWPLEVGGHDPAREPSFFAPYCPERNVAPGYPPTLLLHGAEDTDVPYRQSVDMARELSRHGVEHELLTIPSGCHGFDGDMDSLVVKESFSKVLTFLNRHMAKRPT
jgi:acetyl esterase/lipase